MSATLLVRWGGHRSRDYFLEVEGSISNDPVTVFNNWSTCCPEEEERVGPVGVALAKELLALPNFGNGDLTLYPWGFSVEVARSYDADDVEYGIIEVIRRRWGDVTLIELPDRDPDGPTIASNPRSFPPIKDIGPEL